MQGGRRSNNTSQPCCGAADDSPLLMCFSWMVHSCVLLVIVQCIHRTFRQSLTKWMRVLFSKNSHIAIHVQAISFFILLLLSIESVCFQSLLLTELTVLSQRSVTNKTAASVCKKLHSNSATLLVKNGAKILRSF